MNTVTVTFEPYPVENQPGVQGKIVLHTQLGQIGFSPDQFLELVQKGERMLRRNGNRV